VRAERSNSGNQYDGHCPAIFKQSCRAARRTSSFDRHTGAGTGGTGANTGSADTTRSQMMSTERGASLDAALMSSMAAEAMAMRSFVPRALARRRVT
jgi:hypothetical protein